MPIPQKVIKFLKKARVKYEPVEHRTVYTAYDKAATLKVPQKIIGKTLILKLDKIPVLVLIPANKNLDINKLRKVVKAKKLNFISEKIIKNKLKGAKVGAIPPFGNLWGLPTFVDRTLLKERKIIINGGDYNWSIKINPSNFKKLIAGRRILARFSFRKPNFATRAEISLQEIPDLVIGNFSKTKK